MARSFEHDTLSLVIDQFVRLECEIHEQRTAFDTTLFCFFFSSLHDSRVF